MVIGKAHTDKFENLPGSFGRIAVGGAPASWKAFEDAAAESDAFTLDGVTRVDDPLLLYFTSGTTSKPKLVLHTHQSYPVGHLSTMYWIGLKPNDRHMNISSPGWAKHAWSCFFAPWNAGACVFPVQLQPLQRGGPARRAGEVRSHHDVRPRPCGAC